MDITAKQLYIERILSVTKNKSRIGNIHCKKRHSDCLVYILTGEADYIFGSNRMKAEKGNILYLSRNSEYKIEITNDNYSYYYFDFNFEDSDRILYDCNIYKNELLVSLETQFLGMYKRWISASVTDRVKCMSTAYGIYSEIISSSLYSYIAPERRNDIDYAVSLIHENLDNALFGVPDISEKLGISQVHFRRLFYKSHGVSPLKYITYLRVERAKKYLKDDLLSVSDIAEKCGFASSYYFSRVFKKDTGLTPTEYKKSFM